jgi:hypothetical protein
MMRDEAEYPYCGIFLTSFIEQQAGTSGCGQCLSFNNDSAYISCFDEATIYTIAHEIAHAYQFACGDVHHWYDDADEYAKGIQGGKWSEQSIEQVVDSTLSRWGIVTPDYL